MIINRALLVLTVVGSFNGSSMLLRRKNTFPREIRHNILSNAGKRSLCTTPATNLQPKKINDCMYVFVDFSVKFGTTKWSEESLRMCLKLP